MKKILISQIDIKKPDYKASLLSKEKTVLKWLIDYIDSSLKKGSISYGMLLPSKTELASYLGVSIGTVQNAIRQAEDMGYFESKQSIGTAVKNPNSSSAKFEKMLSKKDIAVIKLKNYIVDNKIKTGSQLPNVAVLSSIISLHQNTLRLALECLVREGVLLRVELKGNKVCWIYQNKIEQKTQNPKHDNTVTTLIDKTVERIKKYIEDNCVLGERIPSNEDFSKMLNVSIRTVNEATRILNEQSIILSRRGRYGTIYLNDPQKIKRQKEREEKSLFMSRGQKESLKTTYLYSWEKTLDALKKYIIQNHESGDKIPSMKKLADVLSVSTNTIKKAVTMLCDEGYLITQRGKYGGIFVLEVPQKEAEAFTWLALNPNVVKVKK